MMWGLQRPDGGRSVGFTGGHWHRNWAIDDFRKAVLNAIVWVAGMEVPKDGVKSNPAASYRRSSRRSRRPDAIAEEPPAGN